MGDWYKVEAALNVVDRGNRRKGLRSGGRGNSIVEVEVWFVSRSWNFDFSSLSKSRVTSVLHFFVCNSLRPPSPKIQNSSSAQAPIN